MILLTIHCRLSFDGIMDRYDWMVSRIIFPPKHDFFVDVHGLKHCETTFVSLKHTENLQLSLSRIQVESLNQF